MNILKKSGTKKLKIGLIASKIESLNLDPSTPSFDSTWQLLEYGAKRHSVRYILDSSIRYSHGKIVGDTYAITNLKAKEKLADKKTEELESFDILMIRKDPPFDIQYLMLMQMLIAIEEKTKIINSPKALANYNEKTNAILFPRFAPKSLVTNSIEEIKKFIVENKKGIVIKGLDNKGGSDIFMVKPNDPNTNEIIAQMTRDGTRIIMCQELLNIRKSGDKRVTVINGEIVGGFLRRPGKDDFRGNICKGASATQAQPTEKERAMAKTIAAYFLERGAPIIGIDFIDGKCTEVNITSPLLSNKYMPKIEEIVYRYIESLCS